MIRNMVYAVSLVAVRQTDGGGIVVSHCSFIVEAFNRDEAVGIGWRAADRMYPREKWDQRDVGASSNQLDPANVDSMKEAVVLS